MNAPLPPVQIDRKRFIGGSDAAAILGVSPWATRLDLFLIKTGQRAEVVDAQRQKMFNRGKRLEPIVVDMVIEEFGVKVTKRSTPAEPNRYVDPEIDYLAAEIDFEFEVTPELAARFDLPEHLVGTIQNGEVKTVHPFAAAKFGEAETDEIPVEYAGQGMHGLMVTARDVTMFVVLVGADNLAVYWLFRDDETIAGMRAQEIEFWQDHILKGVPPAPANLPDVMELFKRTLASRCPATPEIVELVAKFKSTRAEVRVLEEGVEDMKFQIGEYMLGTAAVERDGEGKLRPVGDVKPGVHELHVNGKPILQVCLRNQTRLDGDAIKEKHPDVAAECLKTLSFFVFQSPKKGKPQ